MSDRLRDAADAGLLLLATAVVGGTFTVDVDATASAFVAALLAICIPAVVADDLVDGWFLAAGVLVGYALSLALVGPDVGWVYPAPSFPVVVGGALLLSIPFGSLGVGFRHFVTGRRSLGKLVDVPDRTTAVVVTSATVGGLVFVAGLPRTLWVLPSWSLAVATSAGVVAVGAAFVGGTYRPDPRRTAARTVAVLGLGVSGLVVAAVGATVTFYGGGLLIGWAMDVHLLAGALAVAGVTVVVVEALTAATLPVEWLEGRFGSEPGLEWPAYHRRRLGATVAVAASPAITLLAPDPGTDWLSAYHDVVFALIVLSALGYGAVLVTYRRRTE